MMDGFGSTGGCCFLSCVKGTKLPKGGSERGVSK
jgi:hypothetical protein